MSHAFVLRCAQGQLLAVHLGGPGPLWMRFLDAVEQQHLAKDARFAALEDRVRNWSALLDALAPAFSERSREEWMRRLVAADIPAAEVLCISDVLEEPAVRHSEMFEVVDHPVAGPVTLSIGSASGRERVLQYG